MKKKIVCFALTLCLSLTLFSGCGSSAQTKKKVKLDPSNPVSLTIWHYYNGAQQAAFDSLVSEFNASVGKDLGIYVEGISQGSVSDLESAISDSAKGAFGAKPLPDLFSSYVDTAYALQSEGKLADISAYFTQEELENYVPSYIQEGYFRDDGKLYLFPVAKSTEITMLNATDWEPFSRATGARLSELSTFEGITRVAEQYYRWTDEKTPDVPGDGKAFYGRDSMSNYFIIGMKQQGTDIFSVSNGEVTIQAKEDQLRKLWDNFYVPYVQGWFTGLGKFRSDDVKTGDLLAYTGSSSSAGYFPDQVVLEDGSRPIEFAILPPPVFEGCTPYRVQQGAGMCVTKSDELREYAACEFLKWFTEPENNLHFACASSYLPVRKDANTVQALDSVIAARDMRISSKAYECIRGILADFEPTSFYTSSCFENGYATRRVLDFNLSDKAAADRAEVLARIEAGVDPEEAVAPYLTEENFHAWYTALCDTLESKAHP